MKLYYSKGACSLVVRITINELNLPCEYEAVDLKAKKTETDADFLKINPKGAVPTLQLNDGTILTENAVILQYLADTAHATNLLPAVGELKRYRVLEWVNFITTDLHKGFSPLFNPTIPQEIKDEIFIPTLKNKFKLVNEYLATHKYLMGENYTLPDGYIYVMLRWAHAFKIDLASHTNLSHYFDHLSKRPAIQKSLQEEGL